MEARLALSWNLSSVHGWGIFGLNLVHHLLQHGGSPYLRPLLLAETAPEMIDASLHASILPLLEERASINETPPITTLSDTLMIHSSGNHLLTNDISRAFRGSRNIGFTFFETTDIPKTAIEDARQLDGMRTGSNWNRDYLLENGLSDVICVHQGVDVERFAPGPKEGNFGDRFTVFSGGKLEYRKGQDLVLAAFKMFHARYPDSLLVTNWQNPWPASMASLSESSYVTTLPTSTGDPAQDLMRWTSNQGLPQGAHIDIGVLSNTHLPPLFREIDVAVFTNRCEGGTNLVAMECMASGVPCILSMNTGHLDIADEENCIPLQRQKPISSLSKQRSVWGESDIEEIVGALEVLYNDRERAKSIGRHARERMLSMTWETQISKLLESFDA